MVSDGSWKLADCIIKVNSTCSLCATHMDTHRIWGEGERGIINTSCGHHGHTYYASRLPLLMTHYLTSTWVSGRSKNMHVGWCTNRGVCVIIIYMVRDDRCNNMHDSCITSSDSCLIYLSYLKVPWEISLSRSRSFWLSLWLSISSTLSLGQQGVLAFTTWTLILFLTHFSDHNKTHINHSCCLNTALTITIKIMSAAHHVLWELGTHWRVWGGLTCIMHRRACLKRCIADRVYHTYIMFECDNVGRDVCKRFNECIKSYGSLLGTAGFGGHHARNEQNKLNKASHIVCHILIIWYGRCETEGRQVQWGGI